MPCPTVWGGALAFIAFLNTRDTNMAWQDLSPLRGECRKNITMTLQCSNFVLNVHLMTKENVF